MYSMTFKALSDDYFSDKPWPRYEDLAKYVNDDLFWLMYQVCCVIFETYPAVQPAKTSCLQFSNLQPSGHGSDQHRFNNHHGCINNGFRC